MPGQNFRYNNWDFNVLGTLFGTLTKTTVFESLRDDLAGPLQFEDFSCPRDTAWVYERSRSIHPAYVMRLSTRDMGRIGLLMARHGRWRDRQIISEKWFAESTTSYSTPKETGNGGIGYGYLWWIGVKGVHFGQWFPLPVFSARGAHGQFIVVDPSRDIVVVHKVNSDSSTHDSIGNGEFGQLLGKILSAGPNSWKR